MSYSYTQWHVKLSFTFPAVCLHKYILNVANCNWRMVSSGYFSKCTQSVSHQCLGVNGEASFVNSAWKGYRRNRCWLFPMWQFRTNMSVGTCVSFVTVLFLISPSLRVALTATCWKYSRCHANSLSRAFSCLERLYFHVFAVYLSILVSSSRSYAFRYCFLKPLWYYDD